MTTERVIRRVARVSVPQRPWLPVMTRKENISAALAGEAGKEETWASCGTKQNKPDLAAWQWKPGASDSSCY